MSALGILRRFPRGTSLPMAITSVQMYLVCLVFDYDVFQPASSRIKVGMLSAVGAIALISTAHRLRLLVLGLPITYIFHKSLLSSGGLNRLASIWALVSVALPLTASVLADGAGFALADQDSTLTMVALFLHQIMCSYAIPRSTSVLKFLSSLGRRKETRLWSIITVLQAWASYRMMMPYIRARFPHTNIHFSRVFLEGPVLSVSKAWRTGCWKAHQLWFDTRMKDTEIFRYESLQKDKSEVRLLKLEPIAYGVTIQASFVVVPIQEAGRYEALSYRWTKGADVPILLDGQRFSVSPFVHEMIRNSRGYRHPRLIWIDAICINQEDKDEKSWQVAMMSQIYRGANRVVGWLGYDPHTSGALSRLSEVTMMFQRDPDNKKLVELLGSVINLGDYHSQWNAVMRLLCEDWFCRVWIIQEVALARDMVLKHGREEIPWADFIAAIQVLLHIDFFPAVTSTALVSQQAVLAMSKSVNSACLMDGIRHYVATDQDGLPINFLLCSASMFHATYIEDKIYGILALATKKTRHDPRLLVDYNRRPRETFLELARFLLLGQIHETLDYLHMAGIGNVPFAYIFEDGPADANGSMLLPSWVPRWDGNSQGHDLLFNDENLCCATHMAPYIQPVDSDRERILVHGAILDRIEEYSEIWDDPTCSADWAVQQQQIKQFIRKLDMGQNMVRQATESLLTVDPEHALLRTVLRREIWEDTQSLEDWKEAMGLLRALFDGAEPEYQWERRDAEKVKLKAIGPLNPAMGKKLCITSKGYFGLVPGFSAKGDVLCVFSGGRSPFIIRAGSSAPTGGGGIAKAPKDIN